MKRNGPPTETLTTGQVAEACGVNFRTVIRWIERGILSAHRLPGRGDRRVERAELQRFMRERGFVANSQVRSEVGDDAEGGVLVVDNDLELLQAMVSALRVAGYDVNGVGNGFEAGLELSRRSWAAMILDLGMPDPDGFQILGKIRESPHLRIGAVLVISGLGSEALERARALGAQEILEKPFSTRQLIQRIRGVVPCQTKKAS